MKVLVFLPLLAVVSCAPISDQEQVAAEVDQDDIRVKRAKEVMMFGNQQNEANDKEKRSEVDPGTTGPADKDGLIVANPPVDLELPSSEETESTEETEQPEMAEETGPDDMVPAEDVAEESVEEPLVSEEADTPDSTEIEPVSDTSEEDESNEDSADQDDEDYEKYFSDVKDPSYWSKYYKLLKEADNSASTPYDKWGSSYNSYDPFKNYGFRYRRSQTRRLRGPQIPRARVLKRNRRIKRDLVYPSDIIDPEYLPYTDEYLPYAYPSEEDEVNALLSALDEREYLPEEEQYVYAPYDDLAVSDVEEEPKFYYPKRQAGLNFMPGFKRSRDFYPYYEEPETHFSAFVPTKRSLDDYADAYERVMELAAALRRENYYPEGEYGYEGYDFRRRK